MKTTFKSVLKWGSIMLGAYFATTFLQGTPLEDRILYMFIFFAFLIAYIDGSTKDKIQALEWRVDEISRVNPQHYDID